MGVGPAHFLKVFIPFPHVLYPVKYTDASLPYVIKLLLRDEHHFW